MTNTLKKSIKDAIRDWDLFVPRIQLLKERLGEDYEPFTRKLRLNTLFEGEEKID